VAKFSTVIQGIRARKSIKLPLPGAHVDAETGQWVGPTVDLDVRALRDDEHTDVLAFALQFARKNGLEEPGDGDPLYEKGRMLKTLALACVDTDSPKDDPKPFFDGIVDGQDVGAVAQIQKSEIMTPEVTAYLFMQQELLQDEVNPLLKTMTPVEFMAAAIKTAGGDQSFFVNSRPGMRWSFLRTSVRQLLASQNLSSSFSTSSEPQGQIPS
jgi:hypothetical protein